MSVLIGIRVSLLIDDFVIQPI